MRVAPFLVTFAAFAANPPEPSFELLKLSTLEAVHSQRVVWKMKRAAFAESEGVYQDFRAVILASPPAQIALAEAARDAGVQVILHSGAGGPQFRSGVLFLDRPAHRAFDLTPSAEAHSDWRKLASKFLNQFPEEVFGSLPGVARESLAAWDRELQSAEVPAFSSATLSTTLAAGLKTNARALTAALASVTTHVLARELKGPEILASLQAGHAYIAHDWLCDPTGFSFSASNYFGGFEMGDTIAINPMFGATTLTARVPVPAKLRLFRNGALVAEAHDTSLTYTLPADSSENQGVYRVEALLTAGGADRPWIFSNPLYVRKPWDLRLPSSASSPDVEVRQDIAYTPDDSANKHRLDLYLPRRKEHFPILVFYHGGGWVSGDRSHYHALGNRLARAGIAVAIPSYRLMPVNAHPAQVEDAAAAFAWTRTHAHEFGGDPQRIYVGGHSSGGHLAALLALDGRYLQAHGLDPSAIRGVISMSGVYDVDRLLTFAAKGARSDASPIHHVHANAPPFLIGYCQWDYIGLPRQARQFAAALKKSLVDTQLLFIPRDNHITEIINFTKDSGPMLDAVLQFIH